MFGEIADLLPFGPTDILDVGAGTARDAAWLAARGHRVTGVEPARALRDAGRALHPHGAIHWRDDRLPNLSTLRGEGRRYDRVLCHGVWHHLVAADRTASLATIAALLSADGMAILRLRAGPTAPGRPGFAVSIDRTIAAARATGFSVAATRPSATLSSAKRADGVRWTWLALCPAA